MTEPQVRAQARVQIYEGMNVETVKKNGSDGQKLMASLFDRDKNGKYDEYEAKEFNSYNFTTQEGKITMYNKGENGAQITELIYDDYEKDINPRHNEPDHFHFKNDKNENCSFSSMLKTGKVVIDMVKGKVSVEEAKGLLFAHQIELNAKNSDLEAIYASQSKINLENVKNGGLIFDSETQIETDGKTTVDTDEVSEVEINTEE